MLIIILGIILAIIIFFAGAVFSKGGSEDFVIPPLATFIFLVSIVFGLFVPVSGYNEWYIVNQTELVTLSNTTVSGGTGLIYVSLSAENTYTYRYQIESQFGTETSREYKVETISGKDVVEVEDRGCENPKLIVYARTGKKSIWTLGWATEMEYVFYVPEGAISREVKLN